MTCSWIPIKFNCNTLTNARLIKPIQKIRKGMRMLTDHDCQPAVLSCALAGGANTVVCQYLFWLDCLGRCANVIVSILVGWLCSRNPVNSTFLSSSTHAVGSQSLFCPKCPSYSLPASQVPYSGKRPRYSLQISTLTAHCLIWTS